MHVVFKFKVVGFFLALLIAGLTHIVFGFLPHKKTKPPLGVDLEVSKLDSDLRY